MTTVNEYRTDAWLGNADLPHPERSLVERAFRSGAVRVVVATNTLDDFAALGRAAIAAAAVGGFFLALALITRQVGGGDVKLAVLTSTLPGWLGWNHFVFALLSGLLLAAITATVLIATRRIARRDPLPLGPFLLAGTLVGVLA
jgi:leader peptidase (prepilin peptidase)/N-methyltransferase